MDVHMKQKGGVREGAGRPVKVFDWEKIKQYAYIQCTQVEITYLLDCDMNTLNAACKREQGVDFSDFYKINAEGGKASLRRQMFKTAMSGSVPMMIWLSKNYMNMKENWLLPESIAPIVMAYTPNVKTLPVDDDAANDSNTITIESEP
jgi:hypothetical protein